MRFMGTPQSWIYILVIVLSSSIVFAAAPTTPTLLAPSGGETFEEKTTVSWTLSTDPESDPITYTIELSDDGGSAWTELISGLGEQNSFLDGSTQKPITFATVLTDTDTIEIPQAADFNTATFQITGYPINETNETTWFTDNAVDNTPLEITARVWVNMTDKKTTEYYNFKSLILGVSVIPGGSPLEARMCTASSMTDTSCSQVLRDWAVRNSCQTCDTDLTGTWDVEFPLNLTTNENVLLFEIRSQDQSSLSKFYKGDSPVAGLNFQAGATFYPETKVKIKFAEFLTLNSYPSNINIDLGTDGTNDYTFVGELNEGNSPQSVDLSELETLLSTCTVDYKGLCRIPLSITTDTKGQMDIDTIDIQYNLTSYEWITNFHPNDVDYRIRIKASDGTLDSAYDTSSSNSEISNTNECKTIWTDSCIITQDTTLAFGIYDIPAGVAVLADNVVIDGNNAVIKGDKSKPGIKLINNRQGIMIKNLNIMSFTNGIDTCNNAGAQCGTLTQSTFLNNNFQDNDAADIFIEYVNDAGGLTYEGVNNITNNTFQSSTGHSILIEDARHNFIADNELKIHSDAVGIALSNSADTIICRNVIEAQNTKNNNNMAIEISGTNPNMDPNNNNVVIENNTIKGNNMGIEIINSPNNIIIGNQIIDNEEGLMFNAQADNNYVYTNIFTDNDVQATDDSNNNFDFGRLEQGSKWAHYDESGEGCNDVNSDLRCDKGLVFDADTTDNYPLTRDFAIQLNGILRPGGVTSSLTSAPPIIIEAPPIILPIQDIIADEGDTVELFVDAIGIGTLTYTVNDPRFVQDPTNESNFTWQTENGDAGNYQFTTNIGDGEINKFKTFTVTVNDKNFPPTVTSEPDTITMVNDKYTHKIQANDGDGDSFTFSLQTSPAGMTINTNTGRITWAPTQTGQFDISVLLTDEHAAASTYDYTLTVCGANPKPISGRAVGISLPLECALF